MFAVLLSEYVPTAIKASESPVLIDGFAGVTAMDCSETTENGVPLLAKPPKVTTTFPLIAPEGTGTTMDVADQLVGVAMVPLNVTMLDPCEVPKFEPDIVTDVPTEPEFGATLAIAASGTTENARELLLTPFC